MKQATFITGNQHKAAYLNQLLGVNLPHKKIDLDEPQSTDLHSIVTHKVRQAYQILGAPVLVEDVSLEFTALGNLPGTFIKFFVDADNGLEKLCRMLDGFSSRQAVARCTYFLMVACQVQLPPTLWVRAAMVGIKYFAPTAITAKPGRS